MGHRANDEGLAGGLGVHDVVVGVDRSAGSSAAVERAIAIAIAEHARLTIVAAVRPCSVLVLFAGVLAAATVRRDREEAAEVCLRAALRRVPPTLPVTTVLSFEPSGAALRRCAAGGDHRLVVVGEAPGGRGLRRLLRRGSG